MGERRSRVLATFAAALLALGAPGGCGGGHGSEPRMFGAGEERPAVETFAGKLPCRDCEGYRLTVTLFSDGTFRMRREALGDAPDPDATRLDLGRWEVEPKDGDRLVMHGATLGLLWFRIVDPDHLRMLATGGFEATKVAPVILDRESTPDRIGDRMRLAGMLGVRDGSGVLTECSTTKPYPILPGGAWDAVERGYRDAGVAPGSEVFAEVDARFQTRAAEAGVPPRDGIVVEAVVEIDPHGSCGGPTAR